MKYSREIRIEEEGQWLTEKEKNVGRRRKI